MDALRDCCVQQRDTRESFPAEGARGKALGVAKPAYFPLALPLSGHAAVEH